MNPIHTDICVVGAGPAGIAAALRLRALGYDVCIVEKNPTPPRRAGESLTPSIVSVFEALGVHQRLQAARVLHPVTAHVWWSAERVHHNESTHFCVDRAVLDALLWTIARERNVRLFAPARARRATRTGDIWRIELEPQREIHCRFVVDCSGRAGFLPGARKRTAAHTVALHGYIATPDAPTTACVEAMPEAWCWGAPPGAGDFSAMVFLDPSSVRHVGSKGLAALFRSRLAETALLASCAHATSLHSVRALDATPYAAEEIVGDGFIKLGDAAFALDPLSSTGVEKAMRSAMAGIAVVHTMLNAPQRATLAAGFHCDRQRETVDQHQQWAAGYYQAGRFASTSFWHRRAVTTATSPAKPDVRPSAGALHQRVVLARGVKIVETACIVGDEIATRDALMAPGWQRPVAFVDGIELAPLLALMMPGEPLWASVARWRACVPERQALSMAIWLLSRGVLEAC